MVSPETNHADGDGGTNTVTIPRVETGIPGFDAIALGGLPERRITLVTGTPGSGKTIFAAQFLAAGVRDFGEAGVFVTFEEPPDEIVRNLGGFGWEVSQWVDEGRWAFVDASPEAGELETVAGSYDLDGMLVRIEHAVRKTGARRVAIDSTSAVYSRFTDAATVRRDLFTLGRSLVAMDVTAVITGERDRDGIDISRHGIEEFLADNVIVLRSRRNGPRRQRTIEVLKLRGGPHQHGEYGFTIRPGRGIVSVPLSGMSLDQPASEERLSTGVPGLDEVCGGGFFRGSTTLVAGSTGTGKSLLTAHFIGAEPKSRALLIGTEESRQQIFRNAHSWGIDLEEMEASGALQVQCSYPESGTLEDHLIGIKDAVLETRPDRIAVDSLTALERITSAESFREFVVALCAFLKSQQTAALMSSVTSIRLGRGFIENSAISTAMDSILLLRYIEEEGRTARGLMALKVRGSNHSKHMHRFDISDAGMRVGEPFTSLGGMF